jgi:hypothetical protein
MIVAGAEALGLVHTLLRLLPVGHARLFWPSGSSSQRAYRLELLLHVEEAGTTVDDLYCTSEPISTPLARLLVIGMSKWQLLEQRPASTTGTVAITAEESTIVQGQQSSVQVQANVVARRHR